MPESIEAIATSAASLTEGKLHIATYQKNKPKEGITHY